MPIKSLKGADLSRIRASSDGKWAIIHCTKKRIYKDSKILANLTKFDHIWSNFIQISCLHHICMKSKFSKYRVYSIFTQRSNVNRKYTFETNLPLGKMNVYSFVSRWNRFVVGRL